MQLRTETRQQKLPQDRAWAPTKYTRSALRVTWVQDLQHQLLLWYCQSHTGFKARNSRVWRQWQKAFADFCITLLCTVLSLSYPWQESKSVLYPAHLVKIFARKPGFWKKLHRLYTSGGPSRPGIVYTRWNLWNCDTASFMFSFFTIKVQQETCYAVIAHFWYWLTCLRQGWGRWYYCSTTSNQLPSSSVHFTQQQTWFKFFLLWSPHTPCSPPHTALPLAFWNTCC